MPIAADLLAGTLNVSQPSAVTGSAAITTPIRCFGGTATVTLTGAGGTAPLSFTFNGVTNTTGVFTGVLAGTAYAWSITDANSCGPVTGTLNVSQPSAVTGSAAITTPIRLLWRYCYRHTYRSWRYTSLVIYI